MKLVLKENIRGLGSTGDVVDVKSGYGRNYLLPKRLAVYPTNDNVAKLRKAREAYLMQESGRIEAARIISSKMEGLTLTIEMKANDAGQLFGSVNETIVAEHLSRAIGVEINAHGIILGSHFKKIGEYTAIARLHTEVETEVALNVVAEPTEEELEEAAAAAAVEASAAAGEDGEGETEGEAVPETEEVKVED